MNTAAHIPSATQTGRRTASIKGQVAFFLVAAAAAFGAWLAVTIYLEQTRRDAAVEVAPQIDPQAAVAMTSDVRARRIDELRKTLQENPLNTYVMTELAILLGANGDSERAEKVAILAAGMAKRNIGAQLMALDATVKKGDVAAILTSIDGLVRSSPELSPSLFDQLYTLAQSPEAKQPLVDLLATAPPWREAFFARARESGVQTTVAYNLLTALRGTGTPPTDIELRILIERLLKEKDYAAGFYIWLNMLTEPELKRTGNVFDPGFEMQSRNLYFDWTANRSRTVEVKFVPRSTGSPDKVLRVDYVGSREKTWPVVQYLMLSSGEYVLSGDMKAENLKSDSGVIWQLQCIEGGGGVLGQSPALNGNTEWSRFDVRLVVPQGCATQLLSLRAATSTKLDQNISGTVMFDDINVQSFSKPGQP